MDDINECYSTVDFSWGGNEAGREVGAGRRQLQYAEGIKIAAYINGL